MILDQVKLKAFNPEDGGLLASSKCASSEVGFRLQELAALFKNARMQIEDVLTLDAPIEEEIFVDQAQRNPVALLTRENLSAYNTFPTNRDVGQLR